MEKSFFWTAIRALVVVLYLVGLYLVFYYLWPIVIVKFWLFLTAGFCWLWRAAIIDAFMHEDEIERRDSALTAATMTVIILFFGGFLLATPYDMDPIIYILVAYVLIVGSIRTFMLKYIKRRMADAN